MVNTIDIPKNANASVYFTEFGCIGSHCNTLEQALLYWLLSTFILTISAAALLYTLREYHRNPAMSKPAIKLFYPLLYGDTLFTLAYWPFHCWNVLRTLVTGEYVIDSAGFLCQYSWLLAAPAITMGACGLISISYAPYRLVKDTLNGQADPNIVSKKRYFLILGTGAALGLLWFLIALTTEEIGNFRGIYCATTTWNGIQGYMVLGISFGTIFLIMYFQVKTFHALHQLSVNGVQLDIQRTLQNRTSVGSYSIPTLPQKDLNVLRIQRVAKSVTKFSLVMIGAYIICSFSFVLTTFLNVIDVLPAIQFEMVSGLSFKAKPIIDCMILYHSPVIRRGRKRKEYEEACKKPFICCTFQKPHFIRAMDTQTDTVTSTFSDNSGTRYLHKGNIDHEIASMIDSSV